MNEHDVRNSQRISDKGTFERHLNAKGNKGGSRLQEGANKIVKTFDMVTAQLMVNK